jgi:hypothetical protein
MTVRYHTDHGHLIPEYVCQRRGIQTAEPICQHLPGAQIDQAVSELVLKAVNPASLDVALEVFEELRVRQAEVDRLRRAQVERAREEAKLAQRQYLMARPETAWSWIIWSGSGMKNSQACLKPRKNTLG